MTDRDRETQITYILECARTGPQMPDKLKILS